MAKATKWEVTEISGGEVKQLTETGGRYALEFEHDGWHVFHSGDDIAGPFDAMERALGVANELAVAK